MADATPEDSACPWQRCMHCSNQIGPKTDVCFLSCLHVICAEPCVDDFITQSSNQADGKPKLKCRTCSEIVRSVSDLTGRVKLEDFFPNKPGVESLILKCEYCILDLPAVSYCTECKKHMCKECSEYHAIQIKGFFHTQEPLSEEKSVERTQTAKKNVAQTDASKLQETLIPLEQLNLSEFEKELRNTPDSAAEMVPSVSVFPVEMPSVGMAAVSRPSQNEPPSKHNSESLQSQNNSQLLPPKRRRGRPSRRSKLCQKDLSRSKLILAVTTASVCPVSSTSSTIAAAPKLSQEVTPAQPSPDHLQSQNISVLLSPKRRRGRPSRRLKLCRRGSSRSKPIHAVTSTSVCPVNLPSTTTPTTPRKNPKNTPPQSSPGSNPTSCRRSGRIFKKKELKDFVEYSKLRLSRSSNNLAKPFGNRVSITLPTATATTAAATIATTSIKTATTSPIET